MPDCLIPGCNRTANNTLSIRCRRPDTSAIWAPNLKANLCDKHATEGCTIDVILTPNTSGHVKTNVRAGDQGLYTRITKIK